MGASRRRALASAFGLALALAAAGELGAALWRATAPPDGPEPVAFDRTPCARCGMLVSDPRFAAQLQTRDGRVLHFDDPGCLLLYEHERAPEVQARWFRAARAERWIPGGSVAFGPLEPSPMGYGLAAQERGAPGALSRAEALERALARDAARRGG